MAEQWKFNQITIPITLHTRADSELIVALEKARQDNERTMEHDLKYGIGGEREGHDSAGCQICQRRVEASKYCYECGRPYEEEENG